MGIRTQPVTKRNRVASDVGLSSTDLNFGLHLDKRFWTNGFTCGTWNVRSLYSPGAIKILDDELEKYNMDIVALQETRWLGQGTIKEKNYTYFYSGNDNGRHQFGVAIAVANRIRGNVQSFQPVHERLCCIRLKAKFNNIDIITFHAPTEDKDDQVKDLFYEELETLFDQLPLYDTKLLLGDANAKVGKECFWKPHIGMHSLHDMSNDNGTRLVSFASSKNLRVMSTMFPHKRIHKGTWISPDNVTTNQIDHVLIDIRHSRSVEDVRSLRGAEIGSDHFLVRVKMKQKILSTKQQREKHLPEIDIEKLKDLNSRTAFQQVLSNKFQNLQEETEDRDVDDEWSTMKEVITEAMKETLKPDNSVRKNKKHWFDKECKDLIAKRKNSRTRWLANQENEENKESYKNLCKETNRTIRRKKRQYLEDKIKQAEQDRTINNTREFYRVTRFFKKGFTPRIDLIKDNDGNLISDESKALEQWKSYFENLLNCEVIRNNRNEEEQLIYLNEEEIEAPTPLEIVNVINKLKTGKAAGEDKIPAEVLKAGGEELNMKICNLIQKIWSSEKIPDDWKNAIVCPILKKGDVMNCGNYRGIALLSVTYKVLGMLLLKRLTTYTERIMGPEQAGFRGNRSTIDQIHNIRQIVSKCYEFNKDLHCLLIDFRKAYDSVIKEEIWKEMNQQRIPSKLIKLTKACMSESRCKVRVNGKLTDSFEVKSGLKQGDCLSPILFNLVLEKAIRKVTETNEGITMGQIINILAYADDIILIAETEDGLKTLARTLVDEATPFGLEINVGKTKYMYFTREERRRKEDLDMGEDKFERVDSFKYLGSNLDEKNRMEEEILERVKIGNRTRFSLKKMMSSKLLSRTSKLRMYKSLIIPVVLYGP
uniref:Craniofacial development protein 2 n=1 Tax=Cacopsylla melanoneura TaxID=428564 RepID=A0A8D9DWW4_9HEMI